MIPFILIRKILVSLVPLAIFYTLRKVAKGQQLLKEKSHSSGFDKSQVVEGEIVEEEK